MVAVPFLILIGIWVITRAQMIRVEERIRFVAESRVVALARLGDISRTFSEMRVNLRTFLLATNGAGQSAARVLYDEDVVDLNRMLTDYADKRITGEQGQRMLNDFRALSRQWMSDADKVMSLASVGQKGEAIALFSGSVMGLGKKLSDLLKEWVQFNEKLATDAGHEALGSIEGARLNLMIAVGSAIALSIVLGLLTYRRIVHPIRGLQTAVESIAGGDYSKAVPFTKAMDETGALARSVDVLKRGAEAMEEQRWVKTNAAKLTGELPGSASLAEFGKRLLSGLVPVLGGGVAGFYILEGNQDRLRRVAGYGQEEGEAAGESFRLGEGLVGQCGTERKPVVLADLPPGYCRIASGVGEAQAAQPAAWPLMS